MGVAGLVAAAVIALIANTPAVKGAGPVRPSASIPPRPAPLEAQRLYLAGMDDWARRTPASLNRAVGEFNAAIARDGDYAEAYAGLAGCYDLLREYTLMPSSQAFPLAKAAAERALVLDDRLAGAHASLGFADFYGYWDTASARREFARAIALDPGAPPHVTGSLRFLLFRETAPARCGRLRRPTGSIPPRQPLPLTALG